MLMHKVPALLMVFNVIVILIGHQLQKRKKKAFLYLMLHGKGKTDFFLFNLLWILRENKCAGVQQ